VQDIDVDAVQEEHEQLLMETEQLRQQIQHQQALTQTPIVIQSPGKHSDDVQITLIFCKKTQMKRNQFWPV